MFEKHSKEIFCLDDNNISKNSSNKAKNEFVEILNERIEIACWLIG